MARKRKRGRPEWSTAPNNKRRKLLGMQPSTQNFVRESLLPQYYARVLTLREYLLSRLPPNSKARRKRITSLKHRLQQDEKIEGRYEDSALGRFLISTLVGVLDVNSTRKDERWAQWTSYSQLDEVSEATAESSNCAFGHSQPEIVDFTIWQLFKQSSKAGTRLQHLLCQGYKRDVNFHSINRDDNLVSAIPGIVSAYSNHHVTAMKSTPWPEVLSLMGAEGYKVMIDLILDCGIFVAVETGHENYYQLSGQPLGDLPLLGAPAENVLVKGLLTQRVVDRRRPQATEVVHSPARIRFVHNRMLHARAALNVKGGVLFGLRHIHVLNRYPHKNSDALDKSLQVVGMVEDEIESKPRKDLISTVHVMMYIFPREFGLHNVFTSKVDPRETVQAFKDYTLREDEISRTYGSKKNGIPKRLRGKATVLTQKLRLNHSRCSYNKLLTYYCPPYAGCIPTSVMNTQGNACDLSTEFDTQTDFSKPKNSTMSNNGTESTPALTLRKASLMDYATPVANVSAFCRSVLSRLIPIEFWGEGDAQTHNRSLFLKNVDRFISLRRFETLSLHEVIQGMKIHKISWLAVRNDATIKVSQLDTQKRLQLFCEFVYYMFDSILIPIIRGHFYVTESGSQRYRLFFFRHDIWRSLSEPALRSLKTEMFGEMKTEHAQKILNARTMGFSQLRLLPKEAGVRPIMNLKRRTIKRGYKNMLGSSINSILAPVFNVLTYEKNMNPSRLGSTISSVGELYNKLAAFRPHFAVSGRSLFFVKVDVQSAFDTIPQCAVLKLMTSIPRESEYRISKHVQIRPGEGHRLDGEGKTKSKPIRKWVSLATSQGNLETFNHSLETNLAIGKKNTVFIDNVVSQFRRREELLELLVEHVQNNMVRVGKKFYRQKKGIPQGSILSSLLCNYFYADLEASHFSFLNDSESLLLRLVDDFLLITTNGLHAKRFLQIMHDGIPEYGVNVSPAKTLVNFEVSINSLKIARLVGSRKFPYCGNFINTKTLNITKDRERRKDSTMADALTVEFSTTPGRTFHRKVLGSFKIQAHSMFFDTAFNSLNTVFSNIYDNFIETAMKMWRYAKCMSAKKKPGPKLVIQTITDLIELAVLLLKSKQKNGKNPGYVCNVSRLQVEWLAMTAFHGVLHRKQSGHREVVAWLECRIETLRKKKVMDCARMAYLLALRPLETINYKQC